MLHFILVFSLVRYLSFILHMLSLIRFSFELVVFALVQVASTQQCMERLPEISCDLTSLLQSQIVMKRHTLIPGAGASVSLPEVVKVVFINRDKDTERRAAMEAQGRRFSIPFERFPAVEFTYNENGHFIPES